MTRITRHTGQNPMLQASNTARMMARIPAVGQEHDDRIDAALGNILRHRSATTWLHQHAQ